MYKMADCNQLCIDKKVGFGYFGDLDLIAMVTLKFQPSCVCFCLHVHFLS